MVYRTTTTAFHARKVCHSKSTALGNQLCNATRGFCTNDQICPVFSKNPRKNVALIEHLRSQPQSFSLFMCEQAPPHEATACSRFNLQLCQDLLHSFGSGVHVHATTFTTVHKLTCFDELCLKDHLSSATFACTIIFNMSRLFFLQKFRTRFCLSSDAAPA